jgi:perosamine synthetase
MFRYRGLGHNLFQGWRRRKLPLPVSFAGMTLDRDDAKLARRWLQLRDRWRDSGPVKEFETRFAQWNGSQNAVAFAAGRKALSASLYALGLSNGDEVIVPGYTCIVVQNAFDFAQIRAVYCDIELETYGPDVASIATRITRQTKAIFIQHLYGLVCRDYEPILALAREKGIKVIEDCAHATGARFRGRRIGTMGDIAFYSFEWTKIMTCIAGGIAVTNDPILAGRLKEFASRCSLPDDAVTERALRTAILVYSRNNGGKAWWRPAFAQFHHGADETVGMTLLEIAGEKPKDYLTRMSAPTAALALHQLPKIDQLNQRRRRTARRWDEWCEAHSCAKPFIVPESEPVFLRYPVLVAPERKRDLTWAERELGITPGMWFRTHLHPSPRPVDNCPNATRAVAQCINLPCLLPE